MTYRSLFIEEHASQAAAEERYRRDREVIVLGSLNACQWRHPVERFARENDLPADYIDNCWVRVAMGASALARFLQQDDEPPAKAAGGVPSPDSPQARPAGRAALLPPEPVRRRGFATTPLLSASGGWGLGPRPLFREFSALSL